LSTNGEIARNEAKRHAKGEILKKIKLGNHSELAIPMQKKDYYERMLREVNEEIHNKTTELCQTHQQAHDRFKDAVDRGQEEVRNIEKERLNSTEELAEKMKLVEEIEKHSVEFTDFSSMCADIAGLNKGTLHTLALVEDGLELVQEVFEETLQDVFEDQENVLYHFFTSKDLTTRGWSRFMRFFKNVGLGKVLTFKTGVKTGVKTSKGYHVTKENVIGIRHT
jgi:hypothetical protein